MSLITWPLRHRHVAVVAALIILGFGLHSLLTMPRQDTPAITIHKALVVALYPGATAAQVEQQLTRPIESHLFSFTEIDATKTHSVSREGLVVVTVELREWVKDKDGFWSRLRLSLSQLKLSQLPAETIGPVVDSDFGESVALLIGVTSPQRSYADLRRSLERIEDAIRTVPGAGRIKRYGEREDAIYVEADSQRMARYGVDLPQVIAALRLQNAIPYTGSMKVGQLEIPLHTHGRYSSAEEVAQQVVFSDPVGNRIARVGDVARVERRLADPDSLLRIDGRDDPVLLLAVEMQPGHNIVTFGRELQARLAEAARWLPSDVAMRVINDQPGVVSAAVGHFIGEFFVAVGAVVLVTLILLPLRVAVIAAMAIPVTIAFTFKALDLLGIELHEVSLASLIVVLGMVVDDAIVIADNYVEKLDEGLAHWDAARRSAGELAVPVFTATLAIILAFAPLGFFLSGAVGEFIVALPVTVAIALSMSFAVAMLLTPLLCFTFIREGLKGRRRSVGSAVLDAVQGAYGRLIGPVMRHPRWTVFAAAMSLVAGAGLWMLCRQKFFPAAERAQFIVEVDLPLGTRLEVTDAVIRRVEGALRADPRVRGFAAFVGTSAPRVYYSFSPEVPRPSYGMLLVAAPDAGATEALVRDFSARLRNIHPGARINVMSFQQGIPVDAPVEVRVVGPEHAELRRIGDEVKALFLRVPGATQVRDDFLDAFSVDLDVNSEIANRLGLATSLIAGQVTTGFKGLSVTQLWEHDAPVSIVLRLDAAHREKFSDLGAFTLRAPLSQASLQLSEVAKVAPAWTAAQVARRNGVPTLTVRANPAPGVLASQVLAPIREGIRTLRLPPGYRLEVGGEDEGQRETFGKMTGALLTSVALIYLVLLFQFKGTRETLLVMLAIPLTLLGAVAGLFLTGNPFGFTAAVGMISLVGIVIRNSIILVDHADELRRHEGLDAPAAAMKSGLRRIRPIFLTSMAAAVGVLPMILSGSPLWAPLASVFSVGIIWSMVMTLFVVPTVYGWTMRRLPAFPAEAGP